MQLPRIRSLQLLAIDLEPHVEVERIRQLIGGDQFRTERSECVTGLPLDPLAASFQLKLPFREIVVETVSSDSIRCRLSVCITEGGTHHHGQFHFPVRFGTRRGE